MATMGIEDGHERKRVRTRLSCRICRKRKTKCDRSKPQCQYCIKNDLECIYDDRSPNRLVQKKPRLERKEDNTLSLNDDILKLERELFIVKHKIMLLEPPQTQRRQTPTLSDIPSIAFSYSLPSDHPYVDPNDEIDFYEGYTSNSGFMNGTFVTALSWRLLMRKDPFFRAFWDRIAASGRSRDGSKPFQMAPALNSNLNDGCTKKKNLSMENLDFNTINQGEPNIGSSLAGGTNRVISDEKLQSLNSSIEHSKNPNIAQWKLSVPLPTTKNQIVQLALKKLSNKKVIWLLIERFFKYVYPFMPYIDEDLFIQNTSTIIGGRSMEETNVASLKVEHKADIAQLGVLLFVLEFANFTLYGSSGSEDNDDLSFIYLLRNPLVQDNGSLANQCVVYFKYFKDFSLDVLQLTILKRLHAKHSPLDGDAADESEFQILNVIISQIAVSLGLNRDNESYKRRVPNADKFDLPPISSKLANLKRKLWHFIVSHDSYHLYVIAGPSSTTIKNFEVDLPHTPNETNKNHHDINVEMFVHDSISQFTKYDMMAKLIASKMSTRDVANSKSVMEAVGHLDEQLLYDFKSFHYILFEKYNSRNEYLDSLWKVYTTIQYLEMKSLSYILCYHIFLHFEDSDLNHELALHYFSRALQIVNEICSSMPDLLSRSKTYFGDGFDFMLIPALELSFNKLIKFQYALHLRLNHFRISYRLENRFTNLDYDINRVLTSLYNSYIRTIKRMMTIIDKYYYAWKICKFQRVCITFLLNDPQQFYETENHSILMTGLDPNQVQVPQKSILNKLGQRDVIGLFNLLNDQLDVEKIKKNMDPALVTSNELHFNYTTHMGNFARRSSERTKPLTKTLNGGSDTSSLKNDFTMGTFDFAIDPDIEKWWGQFLDSKQDEPSQSSPDWDYLLWNNPDEGFTVINSEENSNQLEANGFNLTDDLNSNTLLTNTYVGQKGENILDQLFGITPLTSQGAATLEEMLQSTISDLLLTTMGLEK